MTDPEPVRLILRHPSEPGRVLTLQVEDHVTVRITERDALSGRVRRHVVLDLRSPEETAVAAVLIALGYIDVDHLEEILAVLAHDGGRLHDLDDHERRVVEVIMATTGGMDEMLAWDPGDS